jgi:hypothetical protein
MKLQLNIKELPIVKKPVSTAFFNYSIVVLMMVQPLLGSTIFGSVQVVLELFLWLLLIIGFTKIKFNRLDIFLLAVFFLSCLGSFVLNDLHTFMLNFKIFGLCICSLIYFRNINFFPLKFIYIFLVLNILYAIAARFFNIWVIENSGFFINQQTYVNSRPVGFLGSPHATTNFIAIFFIFLFWRQKRWFVKIILLFIIVIYSSWTAAAALIIQVGYIFIERIFKIKINPLVFFISGLIFSYFIVEQVLEIASKIEGSRFYSFEILAPMLFDVNFYKGVLTLFPKSHDMLIVQQELTFASVGNEMGFVKIFTEGGVPLALITLYAIIKRCNYFAIFFFITLLHYSYFVNMPFILFVAMTFDKELRVMKTI